jgi:hypothetical protein
MPNDLLIPPPPATRRAAPRWRGMDDSYDPDRRHQPWLPGAAPLPVADDFSRFSVTHKLRGVALGLAVAALVLAMGRSAQIVDAAYGLDTLPGTETIIAAAEGWHAAMTWLGVPEALSALREAVGVSAD